ncbi:MAG TPA: hypothetical protein DIC41_09340 [Alphaproteobacteria bacterium]|nr:hypothetical protein [Alphaproteobacteria bacterium]HBP73810.1 hypothetical protein [Alphaproteobacteria bacterium]HCD21624.1 hypothetical protein [Alphaproteobacteria bacterium]HCM08654.1 hypothetical protein [Alphaproteobacteria bacterium]
MDSISADRASLRQRFVLPLSWQARECKARECQVRRMPGAADDDHRNPECRAISHLCFSAITGVILV